MHANTGIPAHTEQNTAFSTLHICNWCPHLSTERAGVFRMLGDFNFLHHLPQRGTITCAIFTNNPHLLGALGLWKM